MKTLIASILMLLSSSHSSNLFAASLKATAADNCVNNFLFMFHDVSVDTSGKFKKIIFTFDADKEMLKYYAELSQMTNPVNSKEALDLFKKVKPLIVKNAPKEFNLCVKLTETLNNEMKKICPGIQSPSKECIDLASRNPKVGKLMLESDKAAKELVIAKNQFHPAEPIK